MTGVVKILGGWEGDDIARLRAVMKPSTLLKIIGLRFTQFLAERFEKSGAAQGEAAWQPLKPSTIAQRRGGSSAPLQNTGRLKQSFLGQPATDGQSYVEVGSNMEYASYQQDGTRPYTITAKTGKVLAARLSAGGWAIFGKTVHHPGIPARPVLPTVVLAERLMHDEVESAIEDAH